MKLSSVNGTANRLGGAEAFTYTNEGLNGMSNRLNGSANRLNGLPLDELGFSDADRIALDLALILGDPLAVNGIGAYDQHGEIDQLLEWNGKRKEARKRRKAERQARKKARKDARTDRATKGGRFIDKIGDLASGLAEKFKNEGINPDPELLKNLVEEGALDDMLNEEEDQDTTSNSTPSWLLPVAIGLGALVLVNK